MTISLGELLKKEHHQMRMILEEALPLLENPDKSRKSETTTLYSTVMDLHLFPQYTETYSKSGKVILQDKIPILRELIKKQRWAMLQHYFEKGAATVWILRFTLNMSKARAYDWHSLLEESGLVEPKTTIRPIGKMKRPAVVWGLPVATEAQNRNAYQHHLKLVSPIYRKAQRLTAAYLEAGGIHQASRDDIIRYLVKIKEPPRARSDLARMILRILKRR